MSNNAIELPTKEMGRLPAQVKKMPSFMLEKLNELQTLKDVHAQTKTKLIAHQVITATLGATLLITLTLSIINYL